MLGGPNPLLPALTGSAAYEGLPRPCLGNPKKPPLPDSAQEASRIPGAEGWLRENTPDESSENHYPKAADQTSPPHPDPCSRS